MATFVTNEKSLPLILQRRSSLIGLETSITQPIIDDFCRWVKCSGPQYAVDRMKTIKQIVLNSVSSNTEIPKDFWIRKVNSFRLAGHYGRLQSLASQGDHILKKVLIFLSMYTALSEKETTQEDIQKFRNTVETPGPQIPQQWSVNMVTAVKCAIRDFGLDTSDIQYSGPYETTSYQKPQQEAEFMDSVERLFRTDIGKKLLQQPAVFTPLMNVMGFRGYKYAGTPARMGKVFRIPSPGLKSRWVCNFNKALDHVIKPMGKRVYDSVAKLPWDITFDESKCFTPIQNALVAGTKAFAFDLTAATDRFPWELQYDALRAMNCGTRWKELVELFDTVIKLPAEMPDGSEVTWAYGQPLGAYPSFAVFTFTHGLLLYSLNGCKYNSEFFVHGDDVVILDEGLAMRYKSVLQRMEIDISEFKTLTSTLMTEINAKLITTKHVLTIPKWKPITKSNLLGQMKSWGYGVLKYANLSESATETIKKWASLPVSLGGAGINPLGIPLIERMSGLEDLLFKDKELSFEGSARTKVLSRYLSNPNFTNLLGNALRDANQSDQDRLRVLKDNGIPLTFNSSFDLDILGKNLYSVNPDVKTPIASLRSDSGPLDEAECLISKIRKTNRFSQD
jgi:hypothetical protein